MFTEEQKERLQAELNPGRIQKHPHTGMDYLATWDCIDKANQLFGFDGWNYSVTKVEPVEFGWWAQVDVTVGNVWRQDVGFTAYAPKKGDPVGPAHFDMAIKGAVSDALKRALRSFGNQFGNDLYDKDRGNAAPAAPPVKSDPPSKPPPSAEWAEWLAGINAAQPSEFDDLRTELIRDQASVSQRQALMGLAHSRGVLFNKETGWFFWTVEGKV